MARAKNFSSSLSDQTWPGAHPASYRVQEIQHGRGRDKIPYSAEVKNEYELYLTHSLSDFMAYTYC
jgi:hypothetical protein